MDAPSPARLYATAVGAALIVGGIVGFFYSASFGSPGEVDDALGIFAVNGWANVLHILTGVLGLLMAGYASRQYSLWLGGFYLAVALWGFAIGSGEAILGFLPVNTADNLLHLAIGALGVAAALSTPVAKKGEPATA
jgi:FtsH-binding integral membrane protein